MTTASSAISVKLPASARRGYLWIVVALLSVLCAVALLFPQEARGAVRVWIDSRTYNHCFLIVPIVLYMLWTRRGSLAGAPVTPSLWALPAIALLSLLWSVAAVLDVLEIRQFVVMLLAQAFLVAILGWRLYRALILPFVYLFFLVPSGDFLTGPLQDFTAVFAVKGLKLLGIPVFSNGAVIDVSSGTFAVAEACAGLRFLIATVALGVFAAFEMMDGFARRAIYIALCVVVPIVANGLRVLGIILVSEHFGNATAVESDHVTYGFVFFTLVLAVLVLIGRLFSNGGSRRIAANPPGESDGGVASIGGAATKLLPIFAACCLFACTGLSVLVLLERSTRIDLPDAAPHLSAPWRETRTAEPVWVPQFAGAKRRFLDSDTNGRSTIYRFVALYDGHDRTGKLVSSENRIVDEDIWRYVSRHSTVVRIEGHEVRANVTIVQSGNLERLFVSFYDVAGVPSASLWHVKLMQLEEFFLPRNCTAGFFAIGTDFAEGGKPIAVLQAYLDSLEPPSAYLCRGAIAKPK